MSSRVIAVAFFGLVAGTLSVASTVSQSPAALQRAKPANPAKVVGNDTCVKCHAAEMKVWQATPHAKTFDHLHRRPEAKQIASKLGLSSIKHDGRCVNCHYTQQTEVGSASPHVVAGISCESCHGAAKDWLDIHHDYGGQHVTRTTESPSHREMRLQKSVAAGMRNPLNVYLVAQSCLRCHTTADEELVNVGGHSVGSLDFEFVAWSQGTVRHNFIRSDGRVNQESTPARNRVMFVAGMIAELEASLRATATATQKAKFGLTVAKRADRTAKRLKSVAAKTKDPFVLEVVRVYSSVALKLNNKEPLQKAADKIAEIGYQFAEKTDGTRLGVLDAFIPKKDRWK